MKTFGENLRELRESKGLLLREVSKSLNLDIALVSKFERNERKPTKEQVLSFAKFYGAKEEPLIVAWLSDKITIDIGDEHLALKAMQVAEEKIKHYQRKH